MDIEPDAAAAARDQREVARLVRGALHRAALVAPGARPPGPTTDDLIHPAVVEVAHDAQRALRLGPLTAERRAELTDRLDAAVAVAVTAARTAAGWDRSGLILDNGRVVDGTPVRPAWAVELAGPQPHVDRAVTRALAGVPGPPAAGESPPTSRARAWTGTEREVFAAAARLLDGAWPAMLAELTCTVRQIVVLGGPALDGFTDFTVHGAVFLSGQRLTDEPDGLPAPLHLAEALVHEGTHQRFNAALVTTPPWHRAVDSLAPVPTPLRADPRPLGGLFHQLVVLARSASLFGRLLARDPGPGGHPGPVADPQVLRARHTHHLGDVRSAAATLEAHRSSLTEAGRSVLAQAQALAGASR
ncbi:HEXXH motif-containing putative peptide modification protein [Streptomyces sp. BE20]|uniref:aKG-HExxH-type peptide beta-hydroxylase n=1 Tax=Streptomyces sp. BE20 TaxID=3002525 RepID=UPI002E75F06F|nr:HEXXH motif-containing putative peptide modification protein [Streptomyces sp. BE20]MEE1821318.1 HEXXH motif-containing putative peptide modification protein [Streptomyces sp. BE20]